MFSERELQRAVIVANSRSGGRTIDGVPYAQKLTQALSERLGPIPTYSFEEVLKEPKILQSNVISVGGDGTHTTLLKLASHENPQGWIMTVDGGTMGGIPKSLGLGRAPRESAGVYAERVINFLKQDALGKRDFTPGAVNWSESKEQFVMMAGVGYPWSFALANNERVRHLKHKISRMWRNALAFLRVLPKAPNYELRINDRDPILVKEALIVKAPVKKVSLFTLPYAGDVLFYFPEKTNAFKALGDAFLIALHQKLRFGGIQALPLDGADRVEARETAPSQVKRGVWVDVDSEIRRRSLPATFQSRCTDANCGFQLIYRKGN